MAIVSDRKMIYERKIAELQTQLTEVSTEPCSKEGNVSLVIGYILFLWAIEKKDSPHE